MKKVDSPKKKYLYRINLTIKTHFNWDTYGKLWRYFERMKPLFESDMEVVELKKVTRLRPK